MVFIVKKVVGLNPSFIVCDIIIFTKECINNFMDKHIERKWDNSKNVGDATCIVDATEYDEEGICIGIPRHKIMKCIFDTILNTTAGLNKNIKNLEYFFRVNSKDFPSLSGRSFLKNDMKRILEPIDNQLYPFKFNITLTGIKIYDSIAGTVREIENITSLDNVEKKDIISSINPIFEFIEINNKKQHALEKEMVKIISKIEKYEIEIRQSNEELKKNAMTVKYSGSVKELSELKKEREFYNNYIIEIYEKINIEKSNLDSKNKELRIIKSFLENLAENKVFVATHMHPVRV